MLDRFRFRAWNGEKTDKSLDLEFAKDFNGSIFAIDKWEGLNND